MIVSRGEVLNALAAARSFPAHKKGKAFCPSQDEMHRYQEAVNGAPFVRSERIWRIRKALNAKRYRIDAAEVASKMVDRSLLDAVFNGLGSWP